MSGAADDHAAEGDEIVMGEHPVATVALVVAIHRGIEASAMPGEVVHERVGQAGEERSGLSERVEGREASRALFQLREAGAERLHFERERFNREWGQARGHAPPPPCHPCERATITVRHRSGRRGACRKSCWGASAGGSVLGGQCWEVSYSEGRACVPGRMYVLHASAIGGPFRRTTSELRPPAGRRRGTRLRGRVRLLAAAEGQRSYRFGMCRVSSWSAISRRISTT